MDKDAPEMFRLLRAVDPPTFAAGFARLCASELAAASTVWALDELERLFGESQSLSVDMVARATERLISEAEVLAACPLLTRELLDAVSSVNP